MHHWKKLAFALLIIVVIFLVLDWQYFAANLKYYWDKPTINPTDSVHMDALIAPNRLIISSLGLDLPIIYVDTVSDKVFQDALKGGVVHYPGTALPGDWGNVYIFGHSSDFLWVKSNYRTAFAILPSIAINDEIFISDMEGQKFTYRVKETRVVNPKDLSVLDQYENKQKLLTLQTSYPVGTALKRFVVISELISN